MNDKTQVIEAVGTQVAEFADFEASLAEYKGLYEGIVYDLTVPENEARAKKDRLAIGKVISSLDKAHKAKKGPLKEMVDLLDGERKRIKDQLLGLQTDIKSQIAEHEAAIKAADDALLERAAVFRTAREFEFTPTIDQVQERIDTINGLVIDDSYGTYKGYAALGKEESLQVLVPMLAGLKAIAEQEAAAEQQRVADEAKAREEREAAIAKEAREAAEHEAAEAIEREKQAKADAEQERLAAIERELQAKEKAEQAAKEAAERAKQAEARSKQAAKDALDRAKRDQAIAVERAEAEAKRKAEATEQQRLDAIEAEKAEQAKREANTKHRGGINRAAVAALVEHAGLSEKAAKGAITAIAKGHIPSVSIYY